MVIAVLLLQFYSQWYIGHVVDILFVECINVFSECIRE